MAIKEPRSEQKELYVLSLKRSIFKTLHGSSEGRLDEDPLEGFRHLSTKKGGNNAKKMGCPNCISF